MTALDMDALRSRWARASDRVDANLHLDVAAMREALTARTRRSVRWQYPGLLAELLLDALLVLALGAFVVTHRHDLLYLATGVALLAVPFAWLVSGVMQVRTLHALDFAQPTLRLRTKLDQVRRRRVRLTQVLLYAAVPMGWPAIAVFFKGIFGADLLRGLPSAIYVVGFAVGTLVLIVGLVLGHWLARRYGRRPGYQDFLDDVAGLGWRRLRGDLDAQTQFEEDLRDIGTARALQARRDGPPLPFDLVHAATALRRRVMCAAIVYGVLILANGVFNASQGGQWPFLVPGVLLNFAWVSQMIAAIVVRVAMSHRETTVSRTELGQRLVAAADTGATIAVHIGVLSPVLSLLLAQVLAKACFGFNLLGLLGATTTVVLFAGATIASIVIGVRFRRSPERFAARAEAALSFGVARQARELARRFLGQAPARHGIGDSPGSCER